jgi:hypothetical protein
VSIFTKGSKFRNLNEQAQEKVMNFFFDSPIGLFRKGFWGLNTLCKLGVYSQQSIYADIGYRLRPIKGVRESVENTSRKEANL